MLRLAAIKAEKDKILKGLSKRNFKNAPQIIETILELDTQRKSLQKNLEHNLAISNKLSKDIGLCFQNKETQKAHLLKEKTGFLKKQNKETAEKLEKIRAQIREWLYTIPNIPHEEVPFGTNEAANEIVFESKKMPDLPQNALPHWELAKKYNLIDFELGGKVSGAGFPFYMGKAARLQRALVNYFLDKNTAAGYTEVQPPLVVNEASGLGTGQLPDKEGQMYYIGKDDLYLIPTSEVPITNMYRDRLLKISDLPKAYTAFTPCFRREAGAYGAHVRGLNRLHQFDKVELVRIEHPDNSYEALEKMAAHVRGVLEALQLPFRILRLCGGDLGFTSALTYDFEVYAAAQKKWLEVSSVSNFEDFQSHRLKLRFKDSQGKIQLAHTLNGSSLALPRILAALLENFQTPKGIAIPDVLLSYAGFDSI